MSRAGKTKAPAAAGAVPSPLRCAVYTRKSSEEGLDQAFNSLHAQRDACEAYIRSQLHEGWTLLPDAYDDGGISGGTLERDGLKRLLAAVEARQVDVVVVYKVDRLTRSLTDFARIVDVFDKAGVSFVSVTQAFNTTSSMGRLTLNVLLSFAQFEREVTGERIRDKIALSKQKGMWMGGVPPLGYDPQGHVLVENGAEADVVRSIFARYLKVKSVHRLCAQLEAEGVRSKRWVTQKGSVLGGAVIRRGALFYLLKNPIYVGEIPHGTTSYPGLHQGIVDRAVFDAVQKTLAKNQVIRRKRADRPAQALLTGRIFDADGRPMSPTFSTGRNGRIHRYYVAADLQAGREPPGREDCIRRVGATALERLVVSELRRLSGRAHLQEEDVPALLKRIELRAADTQLLVDRGALFGLDHPDLAIGELEARLLPGERVVLEPGAKAPALRIALPRRMQLRGGRTWIMVDGGAADRPRVDRALVEALRHGHELLPNLPEAGPRQEYLRQLARMAMLAPDIQADILSGRQPRGVTLTEIVRSEIPVGWVEQVKWWKGLGRTGGVRLVKGEV